MDDPSDRAQSLLRECDDLAYDTEHAISQWLSDHDDVFPDTYLSDFFRPTLAFKRVCWAILHTIDLYDTQH